MTRTRILATAFAAALAIGAAASAPAVAESTPVAAAPVAAPAAEGLCLDLSALGLPSVCVGSLIPPGVLSL